MVSLPGPLRRAAEAATDILTMPLSLIWRSGCQGVGVVGVWLVVMVVVVAAGGAVRASGGFARVVMLIFGNCPKTC